LLFSRQSSYKIEFDHTLSLVSPSSELDQELPSRLPSFQILMHPLDVLQGVNVVNPHVELAIGNEFEKLLGVRCKLFSGHDVVKEGGTKKSDVLGG